MTAKPPNDSDETSLDQAARAAWFYYIAGDTQDQVARKMGISRQRAQRLVSKAVAEGLIRVRLDHRMERCLAMEADLIRKYGLRLCRVAPGLGVGVDPIKAIAPVAAEEFERVLSAPDPIVVGLGTGRALRAMAEALRPMDCPHHRMVSLIGNIAPDGSASSFDVTMRLADKVNAPHYPMPIPVVTSTSAEKKFLVSLPPIKKARELAENAAFTFVGIGQLDGEPPLLKDGFVTRNELDELSDGGAVGEIVGWAYDKSGQYLATELSDRVGGVRVYSNDDRLAVGVAAGVPKRVAIQAALTGRIVNGLITDEDTAEFLLSDD